MNEQLIATPAEGLSAADRLRDMARKIELNGTKEFGGAFVIIPPKEAGEPLETLILDGQQDAAQFFILLKGKIDSALAALDAAQRAGQTGFRR